MTHRQSDRTSCVLDGLVEYIVPCHTVLRQHWLSRHFGKECMTRVDT